jgi:hypothetical protein
LASATADKVLAAAELSVNVTLLFAPSKCESNTTLDQYGSADADAAVGVAVGVLATVLVGVDVDVAVTVGVLVIVAVGVEVGVEVGVVVSVGVGVNVGVTVAVSVEVGVIVGVAVGVSVGVAVGVCVEVGVTVGVPVGVTVGVGVFVGVGVAVGVDAGILSPSATRTPRPPVVLSREALINAARVLSDARLREAASYQLPPLYPAPAPLLTGHELTLASPIVSSIPSPCSAPLNDRPDEFASVTTLSQSDPERSIAP